MENNIRKIMHCKGIIPHTSKKCNAELCRTDGELIYLQLESGRELIIQPLKNKGFGIICGVCGYKNFWHAGSSEKRQ